MTVSQSAQLPAGTGNVVVQIVGDGNRTVVGAAPLTLKLTRFEGERHRGGQAGDLDRLSPYSRSTDLVGRNAELASLQAFLADPRPLSVRVLTGGGGTGKTRLALDFCDRADAAGWQAGFATGRELTRVLGQPNLSGWGWQQPTLVVVDYAASHAQPLAGWIDELAGRDPSAAMPPLRLLLLERHADPQTGWWPQVFAAGGWRSQGQQALLDPPEPVRLAPLGDDAQRSLLRQMTDGSTDDDRLAEALRNASPAARPWLGDPLYLMMAGLHAAPHGAAATLALSRNDLSLALVPHERLRLRTIAAGQGVNPDLVEHLAACATLAQGLDRDAFLPFADAEKAALYRPSGGDAAELAEALHRALPRAADGGIAPIVPDLIGEAFVLDVLRAQPQAPLRCHRRFGPRVAQTLVRTVQDFGGKPALGWLEAVVQDCADDEAALQALAALIPHESVSLRDLNLAVTERLLGLCPQGSELSQEERAARATAFGRYANALAQLGRPDDALGAVQEAVCLYHDLALLKPDVYRLYLALSLNNLGTMLRDLDRLGEALTATQKAVDIRRDLALQWPEMHMPDLAMSLNNLGTILSDLDHLDDALAAAQEAVNIRRDLALLRPDMHRPALASSLSNLGNRLNALGRPEDAIAAAQEAVDIRRDLTLQQPDEYRPKLATSLGALGSILWALSHLPAARNAFAEGIEFLTLPFDRHPQAFAGLMRALRTDYLQACEALQELPDDGLLAPVVATFQRLSPSEE